MASYRLSNEAKNDLINIATYGDQNFGIAQSDAYRDQLKAHFSKLADQPELYMAVDHIRKGYRRSVWCAFNLLSNRKAGGFDCSRAAGSGY